MLKKISKLLLIYLFLFFNITNCIDNSAQIEKLEAQIEKKEKDLEGLRDKLENLKKPKSSKGKKEKEEKATKEADSKKDKVFYDLGSGLGKVTVHAYLYDPEKPEIAKNFIEEEYKDVRAEIPDEERNMVGKNKLGSPVYGEIKVDSFEKILKDPDLKINGFKKAVGIELSPTRYHHAKCIAQKLKDNDLEIPGKKLEFIKENIADSDLSDADVIFMCSTCYPEELMDVLVKKFSKLKKGLIVISLKSMPDYEKNGFELLKELSLPMTWSPSGSPVNIYKLVKSPDKSSKEKASEKSKSTNKKNM